MRTLLLSCRSSVAHRRREPGDGVLGAAVCRLQRDAPVRERRADLDDHPPVAPSHPAQGRHRPVDIAQVVGLGHPARTRRRRSARRARRRSSSHRSPTRRSVRVLLRRGRLPPRPGRLCRRRPSIGEGGVRRSTPPPWRPLPARPHLWPGALRGRPGARTPGRSPSPRRRRLRSPPPQCLRESSIHPSSSPCGVASPPTRCRVARVRLVRTDRLPVHVEGRKRAGRLRPRLLGEETVAWTSNVRYARSTGFSSATNPWRSCTRSSRSSAMIKEAISRHSSRITGSCPCSPCCWPLRPC